MFCARVCVCNSSQRRWKKFRGNDRGNESGPSEIVDLLSRVGGGFEFAVNRKLSVPRTHKTCTPRIRTLFHELRFSPRNISDQVPTPAGIPCCFLEFFQPSFLIFFARYFPHGDEIFSSSLFSLFFLICRSPSFVCVFETTKWVGFRRFRCSERGSGRVISMFLFFLSSVFCNKWDC